MAFADEFFGLFGAEFQVVAPGFESDAEHFHFNVVLFRLMLPFLPRLGVLELAEVHYFHDRRVCRGRDFNHVKPPFFGDAESVLKRDFAQVLAVLVNGPDARGAYLVVDAVSSEDKRVFVSDYYSDLRKTLVPQIYILLILVSIDEDSISFICCFVFSLD